jgi:protein-S-isoprenylcysteine O-methyltransferase Ste14
MRAKLGTTPKPGFRFDGVLQGILHFMPSASLIALALFVYSRVPFYSGFLSYLATYIIFIGGALYIAIGFIYSIWAAYYAPSRLEERLAGDYFWEWVAGFPAKIKAGARALRSRSFSSMPPLFETADSRRVVLGIFVKAFFFPLMLQFFMINVRRAIVTAQVIAGSFWELLPFTTKGFVFWYSLLLIVDTGIFMFAYIIEHERLGNKLRSVDPTFGGWFVTLICYPPFAFYTTRRLNQYAAASIGGPAAPLVSALPLPDSVILIFSRLTALILFAIYVAASVALGWRAGNLVNRGIVDRGVYRFVRHPAYAAKNLGWWFERLPRLTFAGVLTLLALNFIYVLRALTEERHLAKDSDYRAYCEKVRWSFIPGIV